MGNGRTNSQKFRDLLQVLDIEHVVCIDDCYSSRVDVAGIIAIADSKYRKAEFESKMHGLWGESGLSPESDIEEIRSVLTSNTEAPWLIALQARMNQSQLVAEEGEEDHEKVDRVVLHKLDEVMDGFGGFHKVEPKAWKSVESDVEQWLQSGRVLVVADEALGTNYMKGTDLLRRLSSSEQVANTILVLLSYSIATDGEHEKTRALRSEGIEATAVTKRDLATMPGFDSLQHKLRCAVLSNESRGLRGKCSDAAQEAISATAKAVDTLTPVEYDEVFFASPLTEGAHEMDTFVRVYSNVFSARLREKLRGDREALELIHKLRRYRKDGPGKPSPGSTSWKLQREEYYESGAFVNSCLSPTQVGDVYQLGSDLDGATEYVIVSAPCDIVVRTPGARKAGVCFANLCKVVIGKPDPEQEKLMMCLDYYGNESGHLAWVNFAETTTLPLWLLDICALNKDGYACIELGAPCPDIVTVGWRKRYEEIQSQAQAVSNAMHTRREVDIALWESENATRDMLCQSYDLRLQSTNLDLKPVLETTGGERPSLRFDIKRVQRLSQILAHELVASYARYVSRPVRPPSLSMRSSK